MWTKKDNCIRSLSYFVALVSLAGKAIQNIEKISHLYLLISSYERHIKIIIFAVCSSIDTDIQETQIYKSFAIPIEFYLHDVWFY